MATPPDHDWWNLMFPNIRWISISRFVLVRPLQGVKWNAAIRALGRAGVHHFPAEDVTIFHLSRNTKLVALPVTPDQQKQHRLWQAGRQAAETYRGEVWIEESPRLTPEDRMALNNIRQNLAPGEAIVCKPGTPIQARAQLVFRRLTNEESANAALKKQQPTALEIPLNMPREQALAAEVVVPPNPQPDVPIPLALAETSLAIVTEIANGFVYVPLSFSATAIALPAPLPILQDPAGTTTAEPHHEVGYYDAATSKHINVLHSIRAGTLGTPMTLQSNYDSAETLTRVIQVGVKRRAESDPLEEYMSSVKKRRLVGKEDASDLNDSTSWDYNPASPTDFLNGHSASSFDQTIANASNDTTLLGFDFDTTREMSTTHNTMSMFNSKDNLMCFDDLDFGAYYSPDLITQVNNNNTNVSSDVFVNTQLSHDDLISQTTKVVDKSYFEAQEAGDELYCECSKILDERILQVPLRAGHSDQSRTHPNNNPFNTPCPPRQTSCRYYFKQ